MSKNNIKEMYEIAKSKYAELNICTEKALTNLNEINISMPCWQADDVTGFETSQEELSGGIQVTGNYPGKARNIQELRQDIEKVTSLLPGNQRLNLHAIYGEFDKHPADRDMVDIKNFQGWVDWAKVNDTKLDFNATFFSHPKASTGFTLSNKDKSIRDFWIEHGKQARKIAAYMGEQQNSTCIHNIWIPDGSKDIMYDKFTPRALLKDSLDKIFSVKYSKEHLKDAVESKLFGIGSESCVIGSYDFYLPYAISRDIMICIDMGHFHLTEDTSDKISSIMQFSDEILLHMTRSVRWDSDHIPVLNDDIKEMTAQLVRGDLLKKVHIALDFFDGSVNRIAAYTIGVRAVQKALLIALLEPAKQLKELEDNGDYYSRLSLLESKKNLPWSFVWDQYCAMNNMPTDSELINEIKTYENQVLSKRK